MRTGLRFANSVDPAVAVRRSGVSEVSKVGHLARPERRLNRWVTTRSDLHPKT